MRDSIKSFTNVGDDDDGNYDDDDDDDDDDDNDDNGDDDDVGNCDDNDDTNNDNLLTFWVSTLVPDSIKSFTKSLSPFRAAKCRA